MPNPTDARRQGRLFHDVPSPANGNLGLATKPNSIKEGMIRGPSWHLVTVLTVAGYLVS
ncbi:hypothetical protein E4U57_006802, partial [Claviceps arundinis]